MATAFKTARTFQTSGTLTAGTPIEGSTIDLRTALGCSVTAKITNGGTGPTVPATVEIQVSNDGSAWKSWAKASAGVANSGVYEFSFDLPPSIMYARTRFADNTVQNVTVEAFGHELTSIG